jgi:hypothetical protein
MPPTYPYAVAVGPGIPKAGGREERRRLLYSGYYYYA